MGYYFALRGWLEMEHKDFAAVRDKVHALRASYPDGSQEALYMSGWCWPEKGINWTCYVFYGADVKAQGLKLLEDVLDAVVALGCHVDGWFHAQGEDRSSNFTYTVLNDSWTCEETPI